MLDEIFVMAFEACYINMMKGNFLLVDFLSGRGHWDFISSTIFMPLTLDILSSKFQVPRIEDYETFEDFMPELAKVIGGVYNRTLRDKMDKLENGKYVYSFMKHSKSGRIVIVYGTINPDRSGNKHDKQLAELI